MAFDVTQDILRDGRARRYDVSRRGKSLRYRDVLRLWQHDEAFRSFFLSLLSDAPFAAYHWETPPVTIDTLDRAFEFAIVDRPGIDLPPDPTPFSEYFDVDADAVVFDNLGRDATLVAPTPQGPAGAYPHLAAFTRQASSSQNHALWQTVGRTMQDRLSDRPIWLNTAGGGVAWLHVRLDARPKYYLFPPYRKGA